MGTAPARCRGWPASGPGRLRPGPWFWPECPQWSPGSSGDFACTLTGAFPPVLVALRHSHAWGWRGGHVRSAGHPRTLVSPRLRAFLVLGRRAIRVLLMLGAAWGSFRRVIRAVFPVLAPLQARAANHRRCLDAAACNASWPGNDRGQHRLSDDLASRSGVAIRAAEITIALGRGPARAAWGLPRPEGGAGAGPAAPQAPLLF